MINHRKLGKTNLEVSEIALGTWQLGGKWGEKFNDNTAEQILNEAIDSGINFIDTADVYNGGLSEKAIGRVLKTRSKEVFVATKCGRFLNPHVNESYTTDALRKFVENSLTNLQVERLDLIQLHCPPTPVYYRPEIFELFDRLKEEGKIAHLGVSIEKLEEGIKAMEYPNVETIQVIFNMFRLKPSESFFSATKSNDVGVIVRVPLASGLLTGKFGSQTQFSTEDHRNFNRNGEKFDKGETFSGVDYATGLNAVADLKSIFGENANMAQKAIKWILMFDEVSTVIPGASNLSQLQSNIEASQLPAISKEEMEKVRGVYEHHLKASVHQSW